MVEEYYEEGPEGYSKHRYWEAEMFALDQSTGTVRKFPSMHAFTGINLEQASKALHSADMPYLRLTGNSYATVQEITNKFHNKKVVAKGARLGDIVAKMSIDDFLDWIDQMDGELIDNLMEELVDLKMDDHVALLQGHIIFNNGKNKHKEKSDSGKEAEGENGDQGCPI